MKLSIKCSILIFSLPLFALAQESKTSGARLLNSSLNPTTKAVIVGISDYLHINDLKYADSDAISLAAYLVEHPDIEKENVELLLNDLATQTNVKKAIYTTLSQAKKDEQVIIYFAGHGDANNTESLVDAGYLLCHGVSKHALYEIDDAINIADIQKWVDAAAEKGVFVVLMIDACRAGRFVDNNSQATVAKALSGLAQGFQKSIKLISCQPNQLSYEDAKWGGGHGVFTHYLLQGLQGAAIDTSRSNQIEVYDLFKYIEEKTVADTEKKQIPLRGGNSTHKILRYYKSSFNPTTIGEIPIDFLPRNDLSNKSSIDISKEKVSKTLGQISSGTYKNLNETTWKQAIKAAEKLEKKEKDAALKEQYAFQKNILEGYAAIALGRMAEIEKLETQAENLYANNRNSAHLLNLLGEFAQIKKEQEKAIYFFNESTRLASNWLRPNANLVSSYLAKQDVEMAFRLANANLDKFNLSERGIMQLDTVFGLAESYLPEDDRSDLAIKLVVTATELDEQNEAESEVIALLNNFEKKYQWPSIALSATSLDIGAMGEALFLASQENFAETNSFELKTLLGREFGYYVDTSNVFKRDSLLDKISYKSAGYGFEEQNKPKFLYLKGHIYQNSSGEKYLVESERTPKTASFVAEDYLSITEMLETIDRTPYKQLLLVLDVDNPDLLEISNDTLEDYTYEQQNNEILAEAHKRIVAERHKSLARYIVVPSKDNNASGSSPFIETFTKGLSTEKEYGLLGLDQLFNRLENKPQVGTFGYHEGGGFLFIDRQAAMDYNSTLYNKQIQKVDSLVAINAYDIALEVINATYKYVNEMYLEKSEYLDAKLDEVEFKKYFYEGTNALKEEECEQARQQFISALEIKPDDLATLQKIIECDACVGKKSVSIEE